MIKGTKRWFSLVGASMALTLLGCSTPHLDYTINASQALNTDSNGNSYAVVVRVYQLRTPDEFLDAEFSDLWQGEHASLGDTLLADHEFVIEPGSHQSTRLRKEEDTRYTGVMAIFRDAEASTWRTVRKVNDGPIPASTRLSLNLQGNTIELTYQ